MNANLNLSKILMDLAMKKKSKIGIGITRPNEEILRGLNYSAQFCEPFVYGSKIPGIQSFVSSKPESDMIDALENGCIDAVVRGQISAGPFRERFMKHYGHIFDPVYEMITVVEFPGGKPMLFSPASNVITCATDERRKLIEASVRLCKLINLPVRIGLLARCRLEDMPNEAGTDIGRFYSETDQLVDEYKKQYNIRNYGIDFESAFQDGVTILIEPDGTAGNQVLRTLYFLDVIKFFGAPYMRSDHTVIETFKHGKDFPDVMLLASALANSNHHNKKA